MNVNPITFFSLAFRRTNRMPMISAVVSCILIFTAISNQSLWIDEAITATYAQQTSVSSFVRLIWNEKKSEAQMPLGMGQAFLFEKFLGSSEYALRLPNLFWLAIGVWACGKLGKKFNIPWLPLMMGAHPIVWYYADEARPYAMQIGIAAVLLWASVEMLTNDRIHTRILAAWWCASLALCATSLMAAVIYTPWFIVIVIHLRKKIPILSQWSRILCAGALILMGSLAIYYVRSVWRGSGGARLWDVGLANIAFMIFEFGGFMAFSPGRIAIREAARTSPMALFEALRLYALPIFLLGFTYAALFPSIKYTFTKPGTPERRVMFFCLSVISISTATVMVLCLAVRFPFWGRHLVALLPLTFFIVAHALNVTQPHYRSLLLKLHIGLLLAGSLHQRINPHHNKDDYRKASEFAIQAGERGKKVLWVANIEAAHYYGHRPAWNYRNIAYSQDWKAADVVIYSKPDIFDSDATIAKWLKTSGYMPHEQWPAFTVWRKQP